MPSVTVSQADGPTHCRYNKYHLNCKFAVVDLTAGSILWRLLTDSLLTVKMKIISRRVTPPLLFAHKAPTLCRDLFALDGQIDIGELDLEHALVLNFMPLPSTTAILMIWCRCSPPQRATPLQTCQPLSPVSTAGSMKFRPTFESVRTFMKRNCVIPS